MYDNKCHLVLELEYLGLNFLKFENYGCCVKFWKDIFENPSGVEDQL